MNFRIVERKAWVNQLDPFFFIFRFFLIVRKLIKRIMDYEL